MAAGDTSISGLGTLARNGRLRAAINTGNRALVQERGDWLAGVSPALARRLAAEIGAPLEPVTYPNAGAVVADADRDAWDVAFLAIDPKRATHVAFTRPYTVIEATYAVRAGSGWHSVADADRPGNVILVSAGSAYDLYLTDALRAARIERAATPAESFAAFRAGQADCVAGVRESLEDAFSADPDITVLADAFRAVEQAMVLARPNDPRLEALDAFVARAVAEGFVAAALAGSED